MQVLAEHDWSMALGRPIHVARVNQRPPSRTGPEFPAAPATLATVDWFRGYGGGQGTREGPVAWHLDRGGDPSRQGARVDWERVHGNDWLECRPRCLPQLTTGERKPQDPSHPRGLPVERHRASARCLSGLSVERSDGGMQKSMAVTSPMGTTARILWLRRHTLIDSALASPDDPRTMYKIHGYLCAHHFR